MQVLCDSMTEALSGISSKGPYWNSGLITLTEMKASPEFSAVGSLFFVRESRIASVELWDFVEGRYCPLRNLEVNREREKVEEKQELEEAGKVGYKNVEGYRYALHQKLKAVLPGRKGYLYTRWRLGGKELKLVS